MDHDFKFKPFPLISGRHGQTIIGCFLNLYRDPKSLTHYCLLPDQDIVTYEVSTPPDWNEKRPTVVMVHGLCGSHKSVYLVRLSRKLYDRGIRSIRINMRGCGSGKGLARYSYHSKTSDDIYQILKQIKKNHPQSPLNLIGFSMGGNAVLKVAGEVSKRGEELIDQVIGVSPPVHLATSSRLLSHPQNRIYERYFIKLLIDDIRYRQKLFSDLPQIKLHYDLRLFELDELYTAPHIGHSSAFEYYHYASSRPLIPHIEIPCKILYSLDDPIIDPTALDDLALSDKATVYKTENGGHMGFLGTPGFSGGFRWMDSVLFKWLGV